MKKQADTQLTSKRITIYLAFLVCRRSRICNNNTKLNGMVQADDSPIQMNREWIKSKKIWYKQYTKHNKRELWNESDCGGMHEGRKNGNIYRWNRTWNGLTGDKENRYASPNRAIKYTQKRNEVDFLSLSQFSMFLQGFSALHSTEFPLNICFYSEYFAKRNETEGKR